MNEFFDDIVAPAVGGLVILIVTGTILYSLEEARTEGELQIPTIQSGDRLQAVKDRGKERGMAGGNQGSSITFHKVPE